MLSTEEKRFIRFWQDQRADGRLKYYLLYVFVGGIIVSIFIFVILLFFFHISFSLLTLVLVLLSALLLSLLFTQVGWTRNEKRFKSLIRREIKSGKAIGEQFEDDMIAP